MEKVYSGERSEIFKLTPRLYFRRSDLSETDQCNSMYIVGNGAVGIVDVSREESVAQIRQEIKELFDLPLSYIFITHGHGDHIEGLPGFLDDEVTVFASRRYVDGLNPEFFKHRASFAGIAGGTRLSLGGVELELFTPGGDMHSREDMFVRAPEDGYICTGDCVIDFYCFFCFDADLDNWTRMLGRVFTPADKYIIPGHGPVYPMDRARGMAEDINTVRRACGDIISGFSREEIKSMSAERLNAAADAFLAGGSADAKHILSAARQDSVRVMRMALWYLLYRKI